MTSATRLVWELLGEPAPQGATASIPTVPGTCAMCGQRDERTAPITRALGKNFTDQSCFTDPRSDRVCWACMACCSGRPPASLRMWTIVATPGRDLPASAEKASTVYGARPGICLTSRANTRPIIDTLISPPDGSWLVSVATSGQKHVLPYATVNHGSGVWRVRMETVTVTSTPEEFATITKRAIQLRRAGVHSDDILAGRPGRVTSRHELDERMTILNQLTPYTHSPILGLALWSITKGITDDTHY